MKWHYRLVLVFKTKLHLLGGNAALKRSLFYQGEEEEEKKAARGDVCAQSMGLITHG